jgi:hypothetical protein
MKSVSVGLHYFTVMMSVQSHTCTGWCLYTIAEGVSLILTTGYSLMECTVVWILRHSLHIRQGVGIEPRAANTFHVIMAGG